jgi:hypothetical protein
MNNFYDQELMRERYREYTAQFKNLYVPSRIDRQVSLFEALATQVRAWFGLNQRAITTQRNAQFSGRGVVAK